MDDYQEDYDEKCPSCGHTPIRWRDCTNIHCDDGFIDLYEDDPLWYDEGDLEVCPECNGTGIERWCPNCGTTIVTLSADDGDADPDAEPMPIEIIDSEVQP